MFSCCSSLKELNVTNFNTDKVTNMFFMFKGCSSLKELNISNFNIDNVTNMYYMFSRCSNELIASVRGQNMGFRDEAFAIPNF